ncbi:alanyl-tRNA editing protein [Paenibacillus bovis]|uniref:Hydrolase n=1 Tax=Paenibacillus bovis TaxID=1616788 RepID=A0A172ZHS1_9BACL|nr:alanine--tRNA ligase-related protein [Paenibacillus bovis]ANF96952.1 hydrolase [Paenibacillus bovis]
MMNTLYYESAYTTSWDTVITEAYEHQGRYYICLAETAFYPEGGGQPSDTGMIGNVRVLDVQRREQQIVHQIEQLGGLEIGSAIHCQIDWQRRFDHMQQHTGQHLLSAICLQEWSAPTLSFHMGEDYATIDIDRSSFSTMEMMELEQKVNAYIYQNLPVHSYFVNEEELSRLTLVKMPKVTEHIRIVEIEGVEHNACGGTHVARTGELGILKLYRAEKQKGHVRLFFKYGYRALADYQEALATLDVFTSRFNTGRKDVVERFHKWEEEQQGLKAEIEQLRRENSRYLAEQLIREAEAAHSSVLTYIFDNKSLQDLQRIASELLIGQQHNVLLATKQDRKILLARHEQSELRCGAFFKEHLASFDGKGGGNDQSAQGGFTNEEDLLRFYEYASVQLSQ